METVIFKAFEHLVTERDNIWQLKKTPASLLTFMIIGLSATGFFWGAAQWLPPLLSNPDDNSTALFAQGCCKMLACVFALATLAPISVLCVKHLRTGWTLDTNTRLLRIRKKTIPFDQLATFRIVTIRSYSSLEAVTLAGEAQLLLMAPYARASEMQSMADRLNTLIHSTTGATAAIARDAAPTSPFTNGNFRAKVIFGIAAMWLLGGYLFFPNLVIVGIFDHGHDGLPIWSLGLLFACLGVAMLWQDRKEKRAAARARPGESL